MRIVLKKATKILLIAAVILTLAFIFSQSALPREESKKQSDKVGDIIEEIFPPETPVGGFVQKNIRKLAHFTEFAFLGAEVALYMIIFARKKIAVYLSLLIAPNIALLDETIQVFSNRGPAMRDVMIDTAGFYFASIIFYTVAAVIFLIRNKRKQKLTKHLVNNG